MRTTLESRIIRRIRRSKVSAFVRQDFRDLGGYDQVGRVLRQLVAKGALLNLGYGIYTRARKSSISGNTIPEKPLPELAQEALTKLGVQTLLSKAEQSYNEGSSTQVPTGRVIGVRGRVSRKIGYNGKFITFEQYT